MNKKFFEYTKYSSADFFSFTVNLGTFSLHAQTWNSFADLTQTTFLHAHHTHTTKAHMLDTKHSNNYTPVNSDQTLEIYPFLQQMLYSRIRILRVQIYTWRTKEPNLQPQVIFHLEYLGKQSSNTFTYIIEFNFA